MPSLKFNHGVFFFFFFNVPSKGGIWGFPGGSAVKNLPAKQETWVRSLSREDPLEERMATHSSILAQRIPWKKEPSGLLSD